MPILTIPPPIKKYDHRWHWRTKDGRVVRIREMTDSHLKNTISLLERVVEQKRQQAIIAGYNALNFMQGEMAIFCMECDIAAIEDGSYDEDFQHPSLFYLQQEVLRRERKLNAKII